MIDLLILVMLFDLGFIAGLIFTIYLVRKYLIENDMKKIWDGK